MKRALAMLASSLALGFGGLYLAVGGALFEAETYRMQDPSLGLLALCGFALVAEWMAPGIKLQLLCRGQGVFLTYRSTLLTHLVAVLGAALTPSNTGGVPATVVALGRLGVPTGKGIGVVVQVFVLDLVFFSWSAPLGLFYLINSDTISLPIRADLFALFAVGAAVAVAFALSRRPKLVSRMILAVAKWPLFRRFDDRLTSVARDYARSARAYRRMSGADWMRLHVVTAVGWLAGFVILWCTLGLYGSDAGLFTVLALLASLTLISHFVPTPGGSGFMEASVALAVGAGTGGVAAAVLSWRLLSFYLIFLIGPAAGWLLYFSKPISRPPASGQAPPPAPEQRPEEPSA